MALNDDIIWNCYVFRTATTRASHPSRGHGVEKVHQATTARACRCCHATATMEATRQRG
jgi:hypothetical protein